MPPPPPGTLLLLLPPACPVGAMLAVTEAAGEEEGFALCTDEDLAEGSVGVGVVDVVVWGVDAVVA